MVYASDCTCEVLLSFSLCISQLAMTSGNDEEDDDVEIVDKNADELPACTCFTLTPAFCIFALRLGHHPNHSSPHLYRALNISLLPNIQKGSTIRVALPRLYTVALQRAKSMHCLCHLLFLTSPPQQTRRRIIRVTLHFIKLRLLLLLTEGEVSAAYAIATST